MDRLEEWRMFVEVARRQSFSATARALRKSPQVVTRAIAALEERVGTRLLHRTTRSVSLTSDGAEYLERANRALVEVAHLETPAEASPELRGTVTVTAPVLFGQLHVVPLVKRFLAEHASVAVRLVLVDRVISLAEESIDVAIRIGELPDSALRARAIGKVRHVLVASPAYLRSAGTPKQPEELARHACIAFTGTTPLANRWSFPGRRARPGRARNVVVHPRLEVNTGQAAIAAALLGLGIARVYSYQIAGTPLRILLEDYEPPPLPVHVVQLPGVTSRATAAFVELAAKTLLR
jgi:DNA-binding transcriptional LysR family regulator